MSSSINQGVLVTIICEAVFQRRLIDFLKKIGASGYTLTSATGAGTHGERMGDIEGFNKNIEVKTIVTADISDQILEELRPFRDTHALTVFRQTVDGFFD